MRLYDTQGRLVVNNATPTSITIDLGTLVDARFIRKDIGDVFSGVVYTFDTIGNNLRFYSGKLQVQNETTLLWHTIRIKNADDGGPIIFCDDTGIA